jgi:gamma-glutamyltranspeptidase/glutathione hydrolase
MRFSPLPRARVPAPLSLAVLAAVTGLSACSPAPPPEADDGLGGAPVFPATNRPDVRGTHGAISAGHPLAAAAGLRVLQEGGNAVDAAVTAAAVLAVVRPHMNGIGGDAFALILEAETGTVHGLNGSGRAGALAERTFFTDQELAEVPQNGAMSISVPGAVAAWADALARFGTWSLADVLAPAIGYARDGFPVSTRLASDFRAQSGALNEAGLAQFLPGGEPPAVGSLLRNPALAETLERIARSGKSGYYTGPVAEHLTGFIESEGGYLRAPDLASHTSTWVDPVSRPYMGQDMHVLPPNTQGVAQLALFGLEEAADVTSLGPDTPEYLHTLIELKKLAFADRNAWVADPGFYPVPVDAMLDRAYLGERAGMVNPSRAAEQVETGITPDVVASGPEGMDDSGDTVFLTVVDAQGNAVSWIQSLFAGFGSGLFEPETGVMLHNRGALFTLEEGHPNVVEPGKRPYHTLTPLLALQDGQLAFTLGTPGGDSQVQTIAQIVNNLLAFGMTPQAAIEAPRFRSYAGLRVSIEDRIAPETLAALAALGHELRVVHGWTSTFGGAQMIRREPGSGTLTVASDPRREAYGLAY